MNQKFYRTAENQSKRRSKDSNSGPPTVRAGVLTTASPLLFFLIYWTTPSHVNFLAFPIRLINAQKNEMHLVRGVLEAQAATWITARRLLTRGTCSLSSRNLLFVSSPVHVHVHVT